MTWQTHRAIGCGELKAEEDEAVVFLIHFCIKALCRAFNSAALLFDNYRHQLPKLFISFRPGTAFTQRNANFWNVTSYFYLLHSYTVTFVKNRKIFHSRVDDQRHFSFFLMYTLPHIF